MTTDMCDIKYRTRPNLRQIYQVKPKKSILWCSVLIHLVHKIPLEWYKIDCITYAGRWINWWGWNYLVSKVLFHPYLCRFLKINTFNICTFLMQKLKKIYNIFVYVIIMLYNSNINNQNVYLEKKKQR